MRKQTSNAGHFVWAFIIAAVGYFVFYQADHYVRSRKGPWRVEFGREGSGAPSLVVHQEKLGISAFKIVFPGESLPPGQWPVMMVFDQPGLKLPFGELAFDDVTFLPGTVVMNLFGHGVQLLPRSLTVDKQVMEWPGASHYDVPATNKFPYPVRKN